MQTLAENIPGDGHGLHDRWLPVRNTTDGDVIDVVDRPVCPQVMETDASQDFEDYWNEYKIIQETRQLDSFLDEECPPVGGGGGGGGSGPDELTGGSVPDGAVEADWLSSAGLSFLAESYENGCEVLDSELEPAIRHLSTRQADAVRLRVRSLNHTVRQRGRQLKARHKKPDIRDVFRDFEVSASDNRSPVCSL